MKSNSVYIVGVGMTNFLKPSKNNPDYDQLGAMALRNALKDSTLTYDSVDQVVVGHVYGDSTCGQRAVYHVGMKGIPIYNVNNNCATGSSALFLGTQIIKSGDSECVVALGFEKMQTGSLKEHWGDRVSPMDRSFKHTDTVRGWNKNLPFALQMFGNAAREHCERYGTTKEQLSKIGEKNHRHSQHNPYSQFKTVYTLDQVIKSGDVYDPLTKLQCCPTSDGAACAIICSKNFMEKNNLEKQAIEIMGMSLTTDAEDTYIPGSVIPLIGTEMTRSCAKKVFQQSGVNINQVDVIELHDCFSINELVTYESLGMCPVGDGGKLLDANMTTYGGKWVVNPSGGLISKGHPLGATGLAQVSEITWQLRNQAGMRQVQNARIGLTHNIGLGGACVMGVYKKYLNQSVPRL